MVCQYARTILSFAAHKRSNVQEPCSSDQEERIKDESWVAGKEIASGTATSNRVRLLLQSKCWSYDQPDIEICRATVTGGPNAAMVSCSRKNKIEGLPRSFASRSISLLISFPYRPFRRLCATSLAKSIRLLLVALLLSK